MSVTRISLAEILRERVRLEVESIDRMYLNVYIPKLQRESGASWFLKEQRKYPVASSAAMAPISRAFVEAIEEYAQTHQISLLRFEKGQRKDDIVAPYLRQAAGREGIVLIGKAQEKTTTFRTTKGHGPRTQNCYPKLYRTTALVNQYYFYGLDADFGPFFLKFSSYFPYTAKFCLNGHEYLKCQLAQGGIAYEALDNGILSCADPVGMQTLADDLSAEKIERLVRKWLACLPQPFTADERAAGYDYEISILQAEFALTQVLDRPLTGRLFFEAAIRENLDLGRPEEVQLIFERKVTRRTPGRFRTRIITEGVTPALHIDYKHSRIKQYHKEGRALRTETTINNSRDFYLGKRLKNLPALRLIGFQANRRLLHVQSLSHNCLLGEDAFQQVNQPQTVSGQRVAALRFTDPRVHALLSALVTFRFLPQGFANHEMRALLAPLLGLAPDQLTPGQMTYHLRRLRLHGLIERLPGTHRYQVTILGWRTAFFYTRTYSRVIRPGLAYIVPAVPSTNHVLQRYFDQLDTAMNDWFAQANLTS
ncbi:MAG: hypothetical protein JSV68_08585 [Anaerolineaceae bacterium]|nr:MAG: hypothetical protein JSV68_08585 [Anaerolineaceae bacterium]